MKIDRFDLEDPMVDRHPDFFAIRREATDTAVLDPRNPAPARGQARARLRMTNLPDEIAGAVRGTLGKLLKQGARGFVFDGLDARALDFYARLLSDLRSEAPDTLFIAATPGLPREDALALAGSGFDFCLSSFGWWDLKARWLIDEHHDLAPHCSLLSEITRASAVKVTDPVQAQGLLAAAAFAGSGVIVPHELAQRAPDVAGALEAGCEAASFRGGMQMLTSAGSAVTALARHDAASARDARGALLMLANTSGEPAQVPETVLAGQEWQDLALLSGTGEPLAVLAPHETRLIRATRSKPVTSKPRRGKKAAAEAGKQPRIVIENLSPSVAGGPFPVKRVVGDRVEVTADIYTEGHEKVGAELLWRSETDKTWRAVPMLEEGNDVWRASFSLDRVGRHMFTVEAWDDRFGYFQEGIVKKADAGVAQPVDFMEARQFLEEALAKAEGKHKAILEDALTGLDRADSDRARAEVLDAPAVTEAMMALDPRHHRTAAEPVLIDAERIEARFSSWYEIFPRSMTDDKQHHGTFRDVIDHLPRIAAMGFDTLYFPPIHPIGHTNRKGPNNTLTPEPGDPGSPYAIGSEEGGHDAIHPELGDFEDFRALVAAAKDHGLEIALDFAIQCSPDHPWLKEHPGWFDWRPDGSIKYAENPPKKYQDIVNVDFYEKDAIPDLWIALRDVVLLWVKEGVKVFRVDNPHTKPLPFWEWMIREVRQAHPEVIFLSEAFTRPKVMYRLAKVGFSQSYTYFTWRDTKHELAEYIEELTTEAPKEFFRPHFFVNTPDINPIFLQTGGRAGHRIRAVLAATLSGLWGVYSGFELCDAVPLPGREEYLDSEKYEIRPREWRTPEDIVDDVTLLNRLRRGHPALQTHLNTRFYPAHNDSIIYYGKVAPDGGDMVLVAVNMDPHNAHGCDFEVPLWEFGLPDDGTIAVEDLVSGERFTWTGKVQNLHLTPDEPYRIWRIQEQGAHNG
jgi:starch synthase (maltosyl-transferring)